MFVAGELGLLKAQPDRWVDFSSASVDLHFGTEHAVEASETTGLMVKVTIPPAFGLTPRLIEHPIINLREDADKKSVRQVLEFAEATPLEYLDRWIAANEVFGDDVRLASVVRWADGQVSFTVLQPQYHGRKAEAREIEGFFAEAGWTRLVDPSGEHVLFFNYAFGVLAIDALPRNCYVNENGLQPFDVILCRPDGPLESYLGLYPDS